MQQLRCLTRRTYANTYIAQGKPDPGQNQQTGAPRAANRAKARPGHFVMLRMSEQGERIPLTIADTDRENGTITIVYLVMGKSTAMLEALGVGDAILDVCGPLGHPTHIEKRGTVVWRGRRHRYCRHAPHAKGLHASATMVVGVTALAAKTCAL